MKCSKSFGPSPIIISVLILTIDLFCLFLPSTQTKFREADKEIKAELLFSIGSDKENEDFYKPKYFVVDITGKIFILDTGNSRIQCFSPEGKFVHSIGKYGQGPGELSNAALKLKILSDGNLCVIDNGQRRITIFSKEGEYLSGYKTNASYDDMILSGGVYYLTNIILSSNHMPIWYTRNLDKIYKSFGAFIEPTPNITSKVDSSSLSYLLKIEFIDRNMTNITANSRGELIYSQRQPYHIVIYNSDGHRIKDIVGNVGFDTHFPIKIEITEKGVNKSVVAPVSTIFNTILMSDDHFFVPIMSPDKSFFFFDLYSPNFVHISRYKLRNQFFDKNAIAGITNLHIDQQMHLYCLVVSMENIPIFSKYRLLIN